jgi:hypothetical protein
MSDLHLECLNRNQVLKIIQNVKENITKYREQSPSTPFTLFLPGDICAFVNSKGNTHGHLILFLESMSQVFDWVYYTPGNHEYYGRTKMMYYGENETNQLTFEDIDVKLGEACIDAGSKTGKNNVCFIQKSTVTSHPSGIVIAGCTHWTSCSKQTYYKLNESKYVFNEHAEREYLFSNHDLFVKTFIDQMKQKDNVPVNKHNIVFFMTHHVPSKSLIGTRFDTFFTDAYGNDYQQIIEDFNATNTTMIWMFGHSHESIRNKIISDGEFTIIDNKINTYSNTKGYPNEKKDTKFSFEPFVKY